ILARTLEAPVFLLRYQNVYGPGQSLHNPYTGILAIFSALARAHQPLLVFEDGLESRDFVYIDDAVEATWQCISSEISNSGAYNVGSGVRVTVLQIAEKIKQFFQSSSSISVTGSFREG